MIHPMTAAASARHSTNGQSIYRFIPGPSMRRWRPGPAIRQSTPREYQAGCAWVLSPHHPFVARVEHEPPEHQAQEDPSHGQGECSTEDLARILAHDSPSCSWAGLDCLDAARYLI